MALWTPANLTVPARMWMSAPDAVWSGSNLTSLNEKVSASAFTKVGTPVKGTAINGFDPIRFSSTANYLTFNPGAWGASKHLTVFFYGARISDETTTFRPILGRDWAAQVSSVFISVGGPGADPWFYQFSNSFNGTPCWTKYTTRFDSAAGGYNGFYQIGTTNIVSRNGTDEGSPSYSATGNVPNFPSSAWEFGVGNSPFNPALQDTDEIVVFDYLLSAGEKAQIEGWAHWKYGTQASLPGGHTYAGAAPTFGSESLLFKPNPMQHMLVR